MGHLTKPSVIKEYISKYDFRFKKDLGQNYLIDDHTANKIVDALELSGDEIVLEIGPGIGALTEILLTQAKQVIVIEIDPFAINMLTDIFSDVPNLTIIKADVLKCDLHEILADHIDTGEKIVAISNLPYYITSPVIMKLLEDELPFERIVVMMQKEVAARITATTNSKDYSVFTIALNYYAQVEYEFDVSRNVFMPSPNVDSAVVKIMPRENPLVTVKDKALFFKTVKAGFSMRRKTILNCLSSGFSISKEEVRKILHDAGLKENLRAENITIEQFAVLSDLFYDSLS